MAQLVPERNPFMLMIEPEVVFAAMEKSEHLSRLSRQLCRPLDRPAPGGATSSAGGEADETLDADEADDRI
jgi:hypothetical protein